MATVSFASTGWGSPTSAPLGSWATLFSVPSGEGAMTCIFSPQSGAALQLQSLALQTFGSGVIVSAGTPAGWQTGTGKQAASPASSSGACATILSNDTPFVAWQGAGGDQTLWCSAQIDSAWNPQQKITVNGTVPVGLACNAPSVMQVPSQSSPTQFLTVLVWPGSAQDGYWFSATAQPSPLPSSTNWAPQAHITNFGQNLASVPKMALQTLTVSGVTSSEILLFGQDPSQYMEFSTITESFTLTADPLPALGLSYVVTSVAAPSGNLYPLVVWENGAISIRDDAGSFLSVIFPRNPLPEQQALLSVISCVFQGRTYLVLATAGSGYFWTQISVSD